MDTRKITMLFSALLIAGSLLAQSEISDNARMYEFLGKVTAQGENSKNIMVKAFDGDSCFSTFNTRTNGKFAFYGESKKYFILQFSKLGYSTKQLIVNTKDVKYGRYKLSTYKFNINLEKTEKGGEDDKYISVVDIIEADNSGTRFVYKVNRTKDEYFIKSNLLVTK
ncbi:MAG: hypothetical protein ACJAV5_001638 [Vicingaceae bacterium]|jgi:hypothetical protein